MPSPLALLSGRSRAAAALLALMMLSSLAVAPTLARSEVDVDCGRGGDDHPKILPDRIDLPAGFQPEGIESMGRWLFAGSLVDGAIWRANAITGAGEILAEGEEGAVSVGLHIDDHRRLWVAGGPSQAIRVFDARSGELLETYEFPTTGFLNDLDIVDDTVYATDSMNAQLAVIPLGPNGLLPLSSVATTMPLGGDFELVEGFNANGIAASRGWLIVVQSNTGLLFRVDPETGEATTIDTGGYSVSFGDGLEVRGNRLYVVRNEENLVAVFDLTSDLTAARLVGEITSDDLDVPTTATLAVGSLWVVNARFGTDPTAETPYWITRLPRRPAD